MGFVPYLSKNWFETSYHTAILKTDINDSVFFELYTMIPKELTETSVASVAGFLLVATLWGGSFVAIEAGLAYWPPLLFAGVRYGLAGALVLAYAALFTPSWLPRTGRDVAAIGIAGTFVIALYHGLLYVGQLHVSGAIAAILVSLSPVLTAAFAAAILPGERIGPLEVGGFLLGIVGVAVIADPDPGALASSKGIGIALILFGAIAFALGAVLLRPVRGTLPVAALQGWAMVGGAGLLIGGGAIRGESFAAVAWTPTAIWTLVYLTIGSGVIAFLIYFALLDRIGPTQLHLVGYVEPLTATAASWILLGTLVDSSAIVGFVAILAGFVVLERTELAAIADRVASPTP